MAKEEIKTDIVKVGGAFSDLDKQSNDIKKKKAGRKPNKPEDKTEQQSLRVKDSVWNHFRLITKKLETKALEKCEKMPTQGDVFEMALLALEKELK